ncbi:MAG: hypothetical protein HWE12_06965 [Oceanospirillaceae bacterium]|nr:hypothetical protein [Oceanospirillaceae bacterium]
MTYQSNSLCVPQGTGTPDAPFVVQVLSEVESSEVLAYLRQHLFELANKQGWQATELLQTQFHSKGLSQLSAIEVNYEIDESGQTEYYSALVWYDITQPFTQIEAASTAHH